MMRKQVNLTIERLREVLNYSQDSGSFTWRIRPSANSRVKIGDEAGTNKAPKVSGRSGKYRYISIDGFNYVASNLAIFYVTGSWPYAVVKFKNGDGTDCRYENLQVMESLNIAPEQRGANGYRKNSKHRNRECNLRNVYGISVAEYQAKFVAQGGKCAVCEKPETEKVNGNLRWLAVDHDHETGTVRDLLCNDCNRAIGMLKDDVNVLINAVAYLRRHKHGENSNVVSLPIGAPVIVKDTA